MRALSLVWFAAACGEEPPPASDSCTSAFYADADGDGHGDPSRWAISCEAPTGHTTTADDCDDADVAVHPGVDESCNDLDDDCDGAVDVGAVDAPTWFADGDGDGFGDDASTTRRCEAPAAHVVAGGDCDDRFDGVHPGAPETCNGRDDDCDALVDASDGDLIDGASWYADADGDHYGDPAAPVTACARPVGTVQDATDCDDTTIHANPGLAEGCDGLDNDCNGLVDDEEPLPPLGSHPVYADADGDGLGDSDSTDEACVAAKGWTENDDDCDDGDAMVGGPFTTYEDDDDDGFGTGTGVFGYCFVPDDRSLVTGDCDDEDPARSPSATEICNSVDDNCDGTTDGDDPLLVGTVWYADSDGDGHGDDAATTTACDQPTGYESEGGDCDDADADAHPQARELCDTIDNDCDGAVDEETESFHWWADSDGDGYGTGTAVSDCDRPTGHADARGDCDDGDAAVSPGTTEACANDVDDDCDGGVDNCAFDLAASTTWVSGTDDGGAYGGIGAVIAVADLDGDVVADIVLGSPNGTPEEVSIAAGPLSGAVTVDDLESIWTATFADFGSALATGDVDADDADDVLIGAPDVDTVYVFLGPLSGTASTADADVTFELSATPSSLFGGAVDLGNDVDGDGVGDVVFGAIGGDGPSRVSSAGEAWVVPWSTTGTIDVRADATYMFYGSEGDDQLGSNVGGLGDADGDGIDDLVLASRYAGSGAVYVIAGGASAGEYEAADVAAATIEASATGDFYYASIAAADYDGDAHADFVLGAPSADEGRVYAFLGPMSGSVDVSDAYVTWVSDDDAYLGMSVAVADFDLDDTPDVLMGAPRLAGDAGGAFLQLGKVAGMVVTGDLTALSWSAGGASEAGTGVAFVPDWTGDGRPEIAIGAPYWEDAPYDTVGRVVLLWSEEVQ